MVIEIKEKGSAEFYKEAVNVTAQYRKILKNHACKISDYFKQFRALMIAACVVVVLLAAEMIAWGPKALDYACLALVVLSGVMCGTYLYSLKRFQRGMMDDSRTSVLTLDESGVELNKEGSQVVKLAWDSVACVRVLEEGIAFVSTSTNGLVLTVDKKYAPQILPWMHDEQPGVEVL